MKEGQRVGFKMSDDLFKDWISGTGRLTSHVFRKLWMILPDENPRLSGGEVQVHDDFIWELTA